MLAEGTVIKLDGENATVVIIQRSACSGCGGGCANCHKAVEHSVVVKNEIDAVASESVYIKSKKSVIFALCAVLFILPLVIAGVVYALAWGGTDSGIGALTAFLSAFAAFAILYLTVGKKLLKRNEYKMVKIIR